MIVGVLTTNNLERTRLSCWCLQNHKGCTYRAPIRYVKKTWSVVLLNKKIHILLSQVYCVWQVVKTMTIISNNPVHLHTGCLDKYPPVKCNEVICSDQFHRITLFLQTSITQHLTSAPSINKIIKPKNLFRWRQTWMHSRKHTNFSRTVSSAKPHVM